MSGEDVYKELQSLVPDKTGKSIFEGFGKEHNWIGISGLWQLEYFRKLLLRHNIDVMHNEKNVSEALLNTCLDIRDKTKDNIKSRLDIAKYCDRSKLHLTKDLRGIWKKPKANFCVRKDDLVIILKWFKEVKFSDGYAANLSNAVNLAQNRFIGLKSHDHHIIIERLIAVALRGFIPDKEWKDIAELSYFYRQLCAKEIEPERMRELEKEIPVLLCKLEKMFPLGFFNVMQHLMVHLPYEARVGGPVAYRWMYVFERVMHHLRLKVRNKARVEGSIVEACIVQEITNCVSMYFSDHVRTIWKKNPRYNIGGTRVQNDGCTLDVFQYEGNLRGRGTAVDLTQQELNAARLYILTNCSAVDRFKEAFTEEKYLEHPNLTAAGLDKLMTEEFVEWFKITCKSDPDSNEDLWNLANGCSSRVYSYNSYEVNGFRFRSELYEKNWHEVRCKIGVGGDKLIFKAREPSTVQGALVRQMYPEPIGPAGERKPVLSWEDYKWSPGAGVVTTASKIVDEFWWRFKCEPSNQEKADAALEDNFTNKVRQMLHEEKAAAIKRLKKKGQMPTEVDEEGNHWPTKEALISAKPPGFGTTAGWRLLCEHWSSPAFRKIYLTNSRNSLAHGETFFHCSGARSDVSTRQHLKLKTGKDPGITGTWLHTHNLHRGTDQEQICSQRISKRWETFDDAMKNAHGENWEEEHPEFDAQIIYEAAGKMPHGRLRIANELFTKTEKSKIKSRKVHVSQPVRSAREDRLERENDRLQRDNKRLRGIELVVRSLADKGGLDYDAIMQSAATEFATSDSEVGLERGRDSDGQHESEKGMGNNTRGSPSHEKDRGPNNDDNAGDDYDNEGDGDDYGFGEEDDEDGYGDDYYGTYGNGYDDSYDEDC